MKQIKPRFFGMNWRSRYFRKNFIIILLIACIPGMISGIGLYLFGVLTVEEEMRKAHESQVYERAENLGDQLEYLEISLSHWAFDPRFNYSLGELDFYKQFQDTNDISKKLLILQGSNPLIDRVELFLDIDQGIVFSPNFNRIKSQEDYDYYKSILANQHNMMWKKLKAPKVEKNGQIALIHHIPGESRQPFGSIIVNISKSKLNQLLETLTPYNEGVTMLVSQDKNLFISTTLESKPDFVTYIMNETTKQQRELGSYTLEWEQETYSVSFGTMKRLGSNWMYISAAPTTSITSPIVMISKFIVLICGSGLILAFVMTLIASIKIYNPIHTLLSLFEVSKQLGKSQDEFDLIKENWTKVTEESESLQKRLSVQMPQLRLSFLYQLRKGYLLNFSEQELRAKMTTYGWYLDNQEFLLIDVQLIGIYSADNTRNDNDVRLLTMRVVDALEEITQNYFEQFTIINHHDLSVGVLIVKAKHLEMQSVFTAFAEEVTAIINNQLQLKAIITISETVSEVKQIPYLFEEVSIGKRYRTFENKNQLINLQEWKGDLGNYRVYYPFETEKEIIQAVRRGHVAEAEQLIRQFVQELKQNGLQEINIQPGMIQLFSSIQHEILHSGIHPNELFAGRNMFDELSEIRELEWMVKWIVNEVVTPFVEILEVRMNIEMKRLVEQVVDYIDKHYMEDISLESCADMVGVNAYTLSKSFKKILHVNFIDYVTNIRINKAKELLTSTTLKINDISESVGYRHSYFNRIFKKQVGVPPSQYRRMKSSG